MSIDLRSLTTSEADAWRAGYAAAQDGEAAPDLPHHDDIAVDAFAAALRAKMAASRAKGRGGWETCPVSVLWQMLREHVEKGDPRDVACFAMMIWHNQEAGDAQP